MPSEPGQSTFINTRTIIAMAIDYSTYELEGFKRAMEALAIFRVRAVSLPGADNR